MIHHQQNASELKQARRRITQVPLFMKRQMGGSLNLFSEAVTPPLNL
jgi:hypothetical protein